MQMCQDIMELIAELFGEQSLVPFIVNWAWVYAVMAENPAVLWAAVFIDTESLWRLIEEWIESLVL